MVDSSTIATIPASFTPAVTGASAPSPLMATTRLWQQTGTGKTHGFLQLVVDLLRRDHWRALIDSGQGIFKLALPDETSAVKTVDPAWLVEATEGALLSVRNMMSVPFVTSASTQRDLPSWWPDFALGMTSLMCLETDWDSSGGSAPETATLVQALTLLGLVLRPNAVAPAVVPLSDGAVQLEWHRRGADVEIIVGDVEDAGICISEQSGEWEATLDEPEVLEELAARLEAITAP